MGVRKESDVGSEKVRVNMLLPKHQHAKLKKLAGYEGRTVSDMIRQLIAVHLRDIVDPKGEV
jgi:predicted DNA-binding protein